MSEILRVVVGAVALLSCSVDEPPDSGILVLSGASNVRSERGFEERGAEYELADASLSETIRTVAGKLAAEGWQALYFHPLNPSQPTSFVEGWVCFPQPDGLIAQWQSAWKDESSNVVVYDFRTAPSALAGDVGQLHIRISYLEAPEARLRQQDALNETEPNLKRSLSCEADNPSL